MGPLTFELPENVRMEDLGKQMAYLSPSAKVFAYCTRVIGTMPCCGANYEALSTVDAQVVELANPAQARWAEDVKVLRRVEDQMRAHRCEVG